MQQGKSRENVFCVRNKFILVPVDSAFSKTSPSLIKAETTHTVVRIADYTILGCTIHFQVPLNSEGFPGDGSEVA